MYIKSLSYWASKHKTKARFIIVFIYLFLNFLGLLVGDILFSLNIVLSPSIYLIAIFLTLFGIIIYPLKKRKLFYKNFYSRKKTGDGFLIVATFIFIMYSGNSFNQIRIINPIHPVFGITVKNSFISSPVDFYNNTLKKKSSQFSKKENKKQLRSVIKKLRLKFRESSKTLKTIYTILAILLALCLSTLMLGLACSLACSGSEALAFIVAIVGIAGIIFGAVKLIQRISRGKPKKSKESRPSD